MSCNPNITGSWTRFFLANAAVCKGSTRIIFALPKMVGVKPIDFIVGLIFSY